MKAQEARLKTIEVNQQVDSEHYKQAIYAIKEAVSKGLFEASCYLKLSDNTVNFLKDQGYSVSSFSHLAEEDTIIRW